MSENEKQNTDALYSDTRRDLLARQLSNSERYDGAILTLSTVTLGISLTFIKDVVPLVETQQLYLLIVSWCLFGLAIVSTLTSFLLSQWAISIQLEYAKKLYLENKPEYLTKTNPAARATDIANYFSGAFFVIGIILTIVFVATNLGGVGTMTDDTKSKVPLTEGAPVPTMRTIYGADLEKKGAPIPDMQPLPSGQTGAQGQSGKTDQSSSTGSEPKKKT